MTLALGGALGATTLAESTELVHVVREQEAVLLGDVSLQNLERFEVEL